MKNLNKYLKIIAIFSLILFSAVKANRQIDLKDYCVVGNMIESQNKTIDALQKHLDKMEDEK